MEGWGHLCTDFFCCPVFELGLAAKATPAGVPFGGWGFQIFSAVIFSFRPLSAGNGNCYATVTVFARPLRDVGVGWCY